MELGEMQRHGGLVVDEIKLSTHLDLKSSMDIEGFVDLGPFTEEKDKHTKADHGLVVMFQPFVGKWTQIIGNYHSSYLSFFLHSWLLSCFLQVSLHRKGM